MVRAQGHTSIFALWTPLQRWSNSTVTNGIHMKRIPAEQICDLICFKGGECVILDACLFYLYMKEEICPKPAFHRGPWCRWWCLRQWLCNHGDSCMRLVTPACSRNLSDWHSWCSRGQSRTPLVFLWRAEGFGLNWLIWLYSFVQLSGT